MHFLKLNIKDLSQFWPFSVVYMTLSVVIMSCIEPYDGQVSAFEDTLVVNATITNELKFQEVFLSRSYRFEDDGPEFERNAEIIVISDDGMEYQFKEDQPGLYKSTEPFAASLNNGYTLLISTSNGKSYRSATMQLPVDRTSIDNLYAERAVNQQGQDGIAIYIDSFDAEGQSRYYRHEFVETFKIIAPFWSPFDAVFEIEGVETFSIPVILREREERVCYGTNPSKNINIRSTNGLIEDRLSKHLIRFIDREDYVISHRYSILVRQYVQNLESFSYYETLEGLSQNSNNVFSEDQPGFLAGNIFSINDNAENVAGFFEVASVTEQRLFFNFEDYFPGEELPKYAVDCVLSTPSAEGNIGQRALVNLIRKESLRFYDYNSDPEPGEGPYVMVTPQCGDCTLLGTNKVPDFWIE